MDRIVRLSEVGIRAQASSATSDDHDTRPETASAWVVFVTGVDQALEQTCRDVRDGVLSSQARKPEDAGSTRGPRDSIEWQGPILPAVQARSPVHEQGPRRPRDSSVSAPARRQAGRATAVSPPDSIDGPRVVLGSTPLLSIVSISTAIAGWFWSRRQRRMNQDGPEAT